MMGNIGSGGPRSVVAGRDKARPSKSCFLPVFQHSIIPFSEFFAFFLTAVLSAVGIAKVEALA